jgi:hypothetical protein
MNNYDHKEQDDKDSTSIRFILLIIITSALLMWAIS